MTDSVNLDPDWLSMPDLVRDEIMMKVGLDNLESLHRCRQVCRAWNTGILTNIWGKASKRNEISAKIAEDWSPGMWPPDHQICHAKWLEDRGILPTQVIAGLLEQGRARVATVWQASSPEVISCAASFAHHGLLTSLKLLAMCDVDLSKVPSQHLLSLASCVTYILTIKNVRSFDLVALLDSVELEVMEISGQNLSTEETQALVRAMETRVKVTRLGHWHWMELTLDIDALTQYNGQGKCGCIMMDMSSPSSGTEEKLENWRLGANWDRNRSESYLDLRRNEL